MDTLIEWKREHLGPKRESGVWETSGGSPEDAGLAVGLDRVVQVLPDLLGDAGVRQRRIERVPHGVEGERRTVPSLGVISDTYSESGALKTQPSGAGPKAGASLRLDSAVKADFQPDGDPGPHAGIRTMEARGHGPAKPEACCHDKSDDSGVAAISGKLPRIDLSQSPLLVASVALNDGSYSVTNTWEDHRDILDMKMNMSGATTISS